MGFWEGERGRRLEGEEGLGRQNTSDVCGCWKVTERIQNRGGDSNMFTSDGNDNAAERD